MTEDQIQKRIAWHEAQIARLKRTPQSERRRLGPCGKAGRWWREYFVPGGEGARRIDKLCAQNPDRLHFLDAITPCCLPVFDLLLRKRQSDGLAMRGPTQGVRTQAILFAVAMSNGLTPSEVAQKTRLDRNAVGTRLGRLQMAGIVTSRNHKWYVDNQDFRDWCQMRYSRKRPPIDLK